MRQPRTWPESPAPGPHPVSSCRAPHTSVMSVGTRATLPDRTGANLSPAERGCGVRIDLRDQTSPGRRVLQLNESPGPRAEHGADAANMMTRNNRNRPAEIPRGVDVVNKNRGGSEEIHEFESRSTSSRADVASVK